MFTVGHKRYSKRRQSSDASKDVSKDASKDGHGSLVRNSVRERTLRDVLGNRVSPEEYARVEEKLRNVANSRGEDEVKESIRSAYRDIVVEFRDGVNADLKKKTENVATTFENIILGVKRLNTQSLDSQSVIDMVSDLHRWMTYDKNMQITVPSAYGSGKQLKMWPQGAVINTRRSMYVPPPGEERKLSLSHDDETMSVVSSTVVSSTADQSSAKFNQPSFVVMNQNGSGVRYVEPDAQHQYTRPVVSYQEYNPRPVFPHPLDTVYEYTPRTYSGHLMQDSVEERVASLNLNDHKERDENTSPPDSGPIPAVRRNSILDNGFLQPPEVVPETPEQAPVQIASAAPGKKRVVKRRIKVGTTTRDGGDTAYAQS